MNKQLMASNIAPNQIQQIKRAKREWEVTVDALPQLICLLDYQRHILRANRTAERWQLGQVMAVKDQEIHQFLHPTCADESCYLISFLRQAWSRLTQGKSIALEIEDEQLQRYLRLQLQPLLAQTAKTNQNSSSFAVLVLDDITQQKQTEQSLHDYMLELKTRNEELDAFAHTVAHDLKGPLMPILGHSKLLKSFYKKMPAEEIEADLDTIAHNANKMSEIIDALLLLAGVRKMKVDLKPVNMATIFTEVEQRMEYFFETHRAELVVLEPSAWPMVWGYGPWLEEIWVNYLSNGLKYGGCPPRLEVGATLLEAEEMVCFWVRDNGVGLTPAEMGQLFLPFTQLNQTQDKGHGLGLAIVRQIVEKLGGQVSVESEGIPGQGSIFSFTLPRA